MASSLPSPKAAHRKLSDIPGPKTRFILGNLGQFKLEKMHTFVERVAGQYGDIALIKLGPKPAVVLSNPETIQQILKRRPESFRRISAFERLFHEMEIESVFSSEGEQWKRQRELMTPAFMPAQIEAFYPVLANIASNLGKAISHKVSHQHQTIAVDIQSIFKDYTTDITTKLTFGVDTDCLGQQESELRNALNSLFPIISSRLKSLVPYWRYIKLPRDYVLEKSRKILKTYLHQYIRSAQKRLDEGAEPGNLLESMIVAMNDAGDKFSEKELLGNAITLLLAGEDTTANTLAWTIHYLASYPDIQEAVCEEIMHNLESEVPGFDELENFPLTFAAVQEAMRLNPVAPCLYTENIHDEIIENYLIPAGTLIISLVNHESRNADLFADPERFNPRRWLELTAEKKRIYNKVLMPFGAGPRLCPGRALAFTEMKAALVTILKQYRFTHHNEICTTEDSFEFTIIPKNLRVNIYKR